MKPRSGDVLSGTLRLLRKIAEGGMGSVWEAEHLVLGTRVAVKVMSAQWALASNAQARFLREARLTASLDSPHVVRVIDCRFTESDEPYLVLELLRGATLESHVTRKGPLDVADVVDVLRQACAAVGTAHRAGIVHRDLKPENVFLMEGPRPFVKILDFGVARPIDLTACSEADLLAAGTPRFMSPEQLFEPESTSARSDLFSLGAVTYFALTGAAPFASDTLEGLYFAVESAAFARPSELRPELPASLDAWFETALARAADERFEDADAMARALEAAAYGELRRPSGRGRARHGEAEVARGPSAARWLLSALGLGRAGAS